MTLEQYCALSAALDKQFNKALALLKEQRDSQRAKLYEEYLRSRDKTSLKRDAA
jgi:hypothetical protein